MAGIKCMYTVQVAIYPTNLYSASDKGEAIPINNVM